MIIGIHNAFSAFKCRHWWMKPFNFIARCQSQNPINITQKLIESGYDVCVDCRIFIRDNSALVVPQPAHGSMIYKWPTDTSEYDLWRFLERLDALAKYSGRRIYVRVVLERAGCEPVFDFYCRVMEERFGSLTFFGGVRKSDWKLIHQFRNDDGIEGRVEQWVGSMADDARWYERFIPILYAKRTHKRFAAYVETTSAGSDRIMMFDFLYHFK